MRRIKFSAPLSGAGEVLVGGHPVLGVEYYLNVSQHMIPIPIHTGGGEIDGPKEVYGRIVARNGNISDLQDKRNLTLKLADGRLLNFVLSGSNLRATGYFYNP